MLSFFGIANYDFARKYFFKVHLRTDGSSRFGQDTKWGTFYSIGGIMGDYKGIFHGITESD